MHIISTKKQSNYGTLYVVATPIGNINDITYRAVKVLSNVYIIATEDTRHSKKILNYFGIKTKQISYHKHNEAERCDYLIKLLLEGKDIALVSDAGTPSISDPEFLNCPFLPYWLRLISLSDRANFPETEYPGMLKLPVFLVYASR